MSCCDDRVIETVMLRLIAERGAAKTICPSEVARDLAGADPEKWRRLMAPIRRVAERLHGEGRVTIRRKGAPVADPAALRGVYRLGGPDTPR